MQIRLGDAKMVEIPTCGGAKCGVWSVEADGASIATIISHL